MASQSPSETVIRREHKLTKNFIKLASMIYFITFTTKRVCYGIDLDINK
jgi:hypothetical protein